MASKTRLYDRVEDSGSTYERIEPETVAEALNAEVVRKDKLLKQVDHHLWQQARARALVFNISLTQFVEDALRAYLKTDPLEEDTHEDGSVDHHVSPDGPGR